MIETLTPASQQNEQKPEGSSPVYTRSYEPEEFEADTNEERPVALLAERRRQFLASLKTQQTKAASSSDV